MDNEYSIDDLLQMLAEAQEDADIQTFNEIMEHLADIGYEF